MSEIIKNGDIWDIGQTVNGVSRFVFIDGIWYYYEERTLFPKTGIPNSLTEYEYGMHSIAEVICDDAAMGDFKCRRVGNINDLMDDMIVVK
jgi:hypothetical protein